MNTNQQLQWYQFTKGAPFNIPLTPLMALEEEVVKRMMTLPRGNGEGKQEFEVIYNREYVVHWLIYQLLAPLEGLPQDEILTLINEAVERKAVMEKMNIPPTIKAPQIPGYVVTELEKQKQLERLAQLEAKTKSKGKAVEVQS